MQQGAVQRRGDEGRSAGRVDGAGRARTGWLPGCRLTQGVVACWVYSREGAGLARGQGELPSAEGGGIVARPPVRTFQQATGWACVHGTTFGAVAALRARPDDGGAAVGADVSMHGTALLPARLPGADGRVAVPADCGWAAALRSNA